MDLRKISLIQFKNYEQLDLEFSPKINCFVGNNGAGKTNLLDAIYYLSLTKSYFNTIDTQNIMYDKEFFIIQSEYNRDDSKENVYCGVKKGRKKQFKRNNKEYKKLSEHIGLFPIVMISPADTNLILEGSDERRKFLNAVISQYDREYLNDLIKYNRALVQRNVLLKDFARSGNYDNEMIDLWTEQLIPLGENINGIRKKFVTELKPIFQSYYNTISSDIEKVSMEYQSQLNEGDFRQLISGSEEKDRILHYTTVGIHKDDLSFCIQGHSLKKNGSQGQQKTFLVALKFAKFDFIKEVNGFTPILLLDDVFDKFDASRVQQIIKLVADQHFGQIFITDTNRDRIGDILKELSIDYKLFQVDQGEISEK